MLANEQRLDSIWRKEDIWNKELLIFLGSLSKICQPLNLPDGRYGITI